MSTVTTIDFFPSLNSHRVRFYLLIAGLIYLSFLAMLAFQGKLLHFGAMLLLPAGLYIITQPRLALYLFVFLLFIPAEILPGQKLYMYDLAAALLILAAAFDLLLQDSSAGGLPRLTGNYIAVLIMLFLAGLFGYNFAASVRPIVRVLVTLLTFLAVFRLSARTTVESLLKFFFWICTCHAAIGLAQFLVAHGTARAFGFTSVALDDFTMLAAPIGLGFFLWAPPHTSSRYAFGTAIVFGGLIATQSRAPLLFTLVACGFLLLLAARRNRAVNDTSHLAVSIPGTPPPESVRRRIRAVVIAIGSAIILIFALKALLFSGVIGRFERLLTTNPGETVRLRLVLWAEALKAFSLHPLFGIGPGNFRNIIEVIPSVRLDPLNFYVRGLSAHNLFLHYLAETGLLGAIALLALFSRQLSLAAKVWRASITNGRDSVAAILLTLSALLLLTTLLEAGWMWAEFAMAAAFLLALISRSYSSLA